MSAVRNKLTSSVLPRIENATVRYPKSFRPHDVKTLENNGEWDVVTNVDPDDPAWSNDVRITPNSLLPPTKRREEQSEIRLLAAPIANHLLEDTMVALDEPPTSARPTVPLGPPVKVIVPEHDIALQTLPTLSYTPQPSPAPEASVPSPLAQPRVPTVDAAPAQPKLPSTVTARRRAKKHGWGFPTFAVVAFGLAGLGVFGATTDLGQRLDRGLHNMYAIHVTHSFHVSEEAPEPEHSLREELEAPAAPVQLESDENPRRPVADSSRVRTAVAAAAIVEETTDSSRIDSLTDLADVARARHDYAGAQERYRAVIALAPEYLPAKLGLADATWEAGDRDAAAKQYSALQDTYPTRMLPARALERSKTTGPKL